MMNNNIGGSSFNQQQTQPSHYNHQQHQHNHHHQHQTHYNLVNTQGRISLHDIFETSHGDVFIVSSLSTKKDTQIIRIEGRCGMLLFEGIPGVDIFPSHRQAVSYLKKKHTLKSNIRVFAILGYIISEKSSHLLVATKIRNEGELLGSYPINTIIETSWIKIDLSYLSSYQSNEIQNDEAWTTTFVEESSIDPSVSSSTSGQLFNSNNNSFFNSFTPPNSSNNSINSNNSLPTTSTTSTPPNITSSNDPTVKEILKDLQTFPLDGTHFYCENYDLTNYFPSCYNTTPFQYCSEFTWNEWMRKPFENASLSHLCVVLLQGYASIKFISTINASIGYIMKRSKLNPGTHFCSPGINENASPANEYESELIMWKLEDQQIIISSPDSSKNNSSNNNNIPNNSNSNKDSKDSNSDIGKKEDSGNSENISNDNSNTGDSSKDDKLKQQQHQPFNFNKNDKIIKWTSHVWRRGTVPLWWRAFPKNQGNEIELFLKDRGKDNPNPFEKSEIYYQNLLNRYQKFYEYNKDSNLVGIPSIQLISLLKQDGDKQEPILSHLYQKSCENVKTYLNVDLQIYTFDWTNNFKNNNSSLNKTVQQLWDTTKSSLENSSYSVGLIKPFDNNSNSLSVSSFLKNNSNSNNSSPLLNQIGGFNNNNNNNLASSSFLSLNNSNNNINNNSNNKDYSNSVSSVSTLSPSSFSMLSPPSSLSSFNSPNSLNVNSLNSTTTTTTTTANPSSSSTPLPQLISTTSSSNLLINEKKLVFLNYKPQKEIIRYSCLDSLERVNIVLFFNFFQIISKMGSELGIQSFDDLISFGQSSSLEYVLNTFKNLKIFNTLVEFYVASADICSILYHNIPSPQPPVMRELVQATPVSSTSHLLSSQRKYQNTHTDENRSYQYLLFLGNCFGFSSRYFPFNSSIGKDLSPYWISSAPSSCVKVLPSLLSSYLNPSILIRDIDDFCWIFPQDQDKVEMIIYLGQPSVVTEICITVSHGTNSDSFPQSMDIQVGNYLNQDLSFVLQDIEIPRCTTGTKLCYILSNSPWDAYSNRNNNILSGGISLDRYFNRIVKIIFYGKHKPLTIGKVEVFGYHSNSYFSNNTSFNLNINPTYRNSIDKNNSSNYTQLINNDIYQSMERKKQQQKNTLITNTLINYQIDNLLNLLNSNSNSNSSNSSKNHSRGNSKNNSFNDILSMMKKSNLSSPTTSPNNSINLKDNGNNKEVTILINQDDGKVQQPQQQEESKHLLTNKKLLDSPVTTSPEILALKKITDKDEIVLYNDYSGENEDNLEKESNSNNNNISNNNSNNNNNNYNSNNNNNNIETIQLNINDSTNSPISQYIYLVKRLLNLNNEGKTISFLESLELECKRIQLNITPQERDSILKSLSIQSNLLNPERFIFERDEKLEVTVRKNSKYKSSICQRPQCGKPLAFLDKIRHQQCSYCYKRFCPACVSPNQMKIFEFESPKPISVCNNCSILIVKQENLFQKILNADKNYYLSKSKFKLTFYQKVLLDLHFNHNNVNTNVNNLSSLPNSYESLSETLSSLAEYPKGGILNSVPTCSTSPPIESILLAPTILPLNMFWKAPQDVNSVDIDIVLAYESLVYSISIIVDSLGYHNYDVPQIQIRYGKTFTNQDQYQDIGEWVLHPNGWSSSDPNLVIQPHSCVSFILPQPIHARIISLKLTLPSIPTFLSLGSLSIPTKPQLHIGRIAVHGGYNDSLSEISTWSFSSLPLSTEDKDLYENTLYSSTYIAQKRNPLKTNTQIKSSKTIHITLNQPNINSIRGFSLIITHNDMDGVKSQIKGISISYYSINQKNELSCDQHLTQILVPKCRQTSTLYYDFPSPLPPNYILSFEFISNYGGKTTSIPKVNLY